MWTFSFLFQGPTPSNNDTGPSAAYSGSRYVFLEASDYHNYAPGEYCLITSKTCRKLPSSYKFKVIILPGSSVSSN
jgi:hypothetical protein